MKVAIYCHVSTNKQTTENQKIRLVDYCKKKGWKYEIIEETMSTRKTRPKKQELLQRLRNKEFDGVLIWKLDRWARNSLELATEIEEIRNRKIKFISLSDNINLETSTGKLQFQILSAFAEFERNLIRERTLEGLHRARMQGKKFGRPKGKKDSKQRRKRRYYKIYKALTKKTNYLFSIWEIIKEILPHT